MCLPCEFGANPFSGSRDSSYTQKSHKQRQKQNLPQFTAFSACSNDFVFVGKSIITNIYCYCL